MKDYHLLLACDKHYLPYMFVACQSVINGIKDSTRGINQDEQIIFDIIIDSSVNNEQASRLAESFCKRNDFIKANFVFYNADENEFEESRGWGDNKTKSTFYRLLMDRFLPKDVHKILYIDIDVLVLGDVRELLNTPMKEQVLGTVYSHTYWRNDYKNGKLYLNPIKKSNNNTVTLNEIDYFNAGVLLINLDQWRKENTGKRSIDFVHNYNPIVLDQDTLNYITKNNLALDWSWNFQTWMFYVDLNCSQEDVGYVQFGSNLPKHAFKCKSLPSETLKKKLSGCNIIHFTSCKPWKEQPFIADEGRHILFNEQVVKSIQMWQELARQTPECIGVNIPHTTNDSVLGDIINHTSSRLSQEAKRANRKRKELRAICISLIIAIAIIQLISIL